MALMRRAELQQASKVFILCEDQGIFGTSTLQNLWIGSPHHAKLNDGDDLMVCLSEGVHQHLGDVFVSEYLHG